MVKSVAVMIRKCCHPAANLHKTCRVITIVYVQDMALVSVGAISIGLLPGCFLIFIQGVLNIDGAMKRIQRIAD